MSRFISVRDKYIKVVEDEDAKMAKLKVKVEKGGSTTFSGTFGTCQNP